MTQQNDTPVSSTFLIPLLSTLHDKEDLLVVS